MRLQNCTRLQIISACNSTSYYSSVWAYRTVQDFKIVSACNSASYYSSVWAYRTVPVYKIVSACNSVSYCSSALDCRSVLVQSKQHTETVHLDIDTLCEQLDIIPQLISSSAFVDSSRSVWISILWRTTGYFIANLHSDGFCQFRSHRLKVKTFSNAEDLFLESGESLHNTFGYKEFGWVCAQPKETIPHCQWQYVRLRRIRSSVCAT